MLFCQPGELMFILQPLAEFQNGNNLQFGAGLPGHPATIPSLFPAIKKPCILAITFKPLIQFYIS